MRILIQRVRWARVLVGDAPVGEIGPGLLALVAAGPGDDEARADALAAKLCGLRIFADDQGLMNRSLREVGGALLAVSQFTLYADCRKGRRPFFGAAAPPALAEALCQRFVQAVRHQGVPCQTGVFGAAMRVELCNDGPVTIWLDSEQLEQPRRAAQGLEAPHA